MTFNKIPYNKLNPRQQETYNFQKVSAILADYGFATIKLNDDWQGADFIAQHIDSKTYLKVQLKSVFTLDKKYMGKDIFICFPGNGHWYLYNHDDVVNELGGNWKNTKSWNDDGCYHWPKLSKKQIDFLEKYKL